jgi:hypothetical protein
MSYKSITIPGVAYCTAPEGTKLNYGDKINVLYSKKKGTLFVTEKGVYQSHRFSSSAPCLELFNERPKSFAKRAYLRVQDRMISYKEAYENLKEDAKRAIRDGRTEEFCKQLIQQ